MKKKESILCYNCGHEGYVTDEIDSPFCFDEYGRPIEDGPTFKRIVSYCPKCNTIINVESVMAENGKRRRESEREYFDLISHKDILKLPKRYGLPREIIEDILNIESEIMIRDQGVVGLSMWDGALPTSEESERMKRALADSSYFIECLDKAKDNIPKELYERVRPRLERMVK